MTTHSQVAPARYREDRANRGDIPIALTGLLADMFALYLKTKTFIGTYRARTFAITTCCSTSG